MKKTILIFLLLCCVHFTFAESGYELWLRYHKIDNPTLLEKYQSQNKGVVFPANSDRLKAAKKELDLGLKGLLNIDLADSQSLTSGGLLIGTPQSSDLIARSNYAKEINALDPEGYIIRTANVDEKQVTLVAAKTDIGVLYGVFHYLRLMQTNQLLDKLAITEEPKLQLRVLDHWDNLNGTIERGYAGYTLWDWARLPNYKSPRYTDYARANASIGINGAVLNNVNANAKSLRAEWIIKAAALADAFRPYGIRVYLTARFSAPKEIGGLSTADPLDPQVRQWWRDKAKEIYEYIPDFGGFLVKANSEGQPGPQDYGRTHADGANMMAEALEPYGGVVFWRAFVYQNERHIDRVMNGYEEFKPLDGQFNRNVFVQPKNGPIDFQPREPFHPLFGAIPKTALALEFQITQENLGHAGHLVYLGSLFEETLQSDTYENGKGSTVSKVLQNYKKTHGISGIAGVPNTGTDINWTGHLFGQANWHAFGRLAWNPDMTSKDMSEEWIRMTFSNDKKVIAPIQKIMLMSREAAVNYMTPLGLNHIMNYDTHNGPEPWHDDPVWSAFDYHKASESGVGVDRTHTGTNAVGQYHQPLSNQLDDVKTCPPQFLLWFHRVAWDYKMPSGNTLWNDLVAHYYLGVDEVHQMQSIWNTLEKDMDDERFVHVKSLLELQEQEAVWWRDGCVLFFQQYSKLPIPAKYDKPKHSLDYYKRIPYPYNWKESQYK
ncbi:alpha-glucuronidase family glycosyl hydrolase [Dysgonomonas sp. HGC4]|uniref:alpha-glucuronidase family glycosyl hydrolase n=1 Tax=Dysgonomonas sp. HGC4 TaxID=1658009 RepID=UPI000682D7BA|nr:alpha-glucuronidase family glycosyl hydrolase [Dysgonomonas sp. HGC4]MBD8349255.1 alpha-glucuronidase [Dysgonomonas sp. HGC4]